MNKQADAIVAASPVEPLISLRDVCKTFTTGGGEVEVQALRGISLDIYAG